MSAESFLSSVIEVAIAIAGFAGIVAAIRHRDVARWARAEQLLLRMLLTASGMAITFALLPAVLAEAGVPEPTIWRSGSIALLLWQLTILTRRTRQFKDIGAAPKFPPALRVWVIGALLLQASNAVLAASWPYLLGVFSILLNAFTFFLMLLFENVSDEDAAA